MCKPCSQGRASPLYSSLSTSILGDPSPSQIAYVYSSSFQHILKTTRTQLLIGHKAIVSSSRTQFTLATVAYSYAQQTIVADSEGVIVWYDYDTLKKCDPGDEAWRVLKEAMGSEVREGQGRPRY